MDLHGLHLILMHVCCVMCVTTESLRERGHDSDENVRMDVIQAIVAAGKRDFLAVTDNLMTCVKERTLDKKVRAWQQTKRHRFTVVSYGRRPAFCRSRLMSMAAA